MKLTSTAKYTDINPFRGIDDGRNSKLQGRFRFNLLGFITISLSIVGIVIVSYFLIYPLLPYFQDFKSEIKNFDPYQLGYNVTTQLFVSISPPSYEIAEGNDEGFDSSVPRSMEYVDADTVTLSNLEGLDTAIVIDSVGIKGDVVDGYSQERMMDGFWHYPASSIPGERGNTVIFGHRFHRLPPNTDTFYNLDKVVVGDKVLVSQKEETLSYTVVEKEIVGKYDEVQLASSGDYRLTLITCTPLWTSEERLVVVAIQDRISRVI